MHIKLQVSFAEYRLFSRALLQKRPILLRSLLIVATQWLQRVWMCASSCICNTLQHTATRCNTLQHIATCCNTLPHTENAYAHCLASIRTQVCGGHERAEYRLFYRALLQKRPLIRFAQVCGGHEEMRDTWKSAAFARSLLQRSLAYIGLVCKEDLAI